MPEEKDNKENLENKKAVEPTVDALKYGYIKFHNFRPAQL